MSRALNENNYMIWDWPDFNVLEYGPPRYINGLGLIPSYQSLVAKSSLRRDSGGIWGTLSEWSHHKLKILEKEPYEFDNLFEYYSVRDLTDKCKDKLISYLDSRELSYLYILDLFKNIDSLVDFYSKYFVFTNEGCVINGSEVSSFFVNQYTFEKTNKKFPRYSCVMPYKHLFDNEYDYYQTFFHELSHKVIHHLNLSENMLEQEFLCEFSASRVLQNFNISLPKNNYHYEKFISIWASMSCFDTRCLSLIDEITSCILNKNEIY